MAIKAGQILTDGNGYTLDRLQSAGLNNLNIPEEKIYELGNYQTVATVRDIPDLSFDLESTDVSIEPEALFLGVDPSAVSDGDELDFLSAMPMDVISPFKEEKGLFNTIRGVALPYLTLESVTYRFGLRSSATQSYTLRGDSIYYIPGTPYYEEFNVSGTGYTLSETALPYNESNDTIYVLGVCLKNPTTGRYKRLFYGSDYTDTSTVLTLAQAPGGAYTKVHVVYGTAATITYPQVGINPNGNTVHEGVGVKPAAVRGKDLEVWVSDGAATPTMVQWGGVQSFEVTRRVNLENDEEFGNYHFVSSDYDTAEVSGNVVVKPFDTEDLFDRIQQVANVGSNEIVSAFTSVALPVELRIKDPDGGDVLKTLYIPDARFQVPAIQGRVQQKLQVTFNFNSDSGELLVYKGERP